MICQKCGFENPPGDKFCSKCQNVLDFRALDSQMIDINNLELVAEQEQTQKRGGEEPAARNHSWIKPVLLLVVLTFAIGITASIVWPIYNAHIKAEIITEVITAAKINVESYARKQRSWPESTSDIRINIPLRARAEIDIDINHGIIELVVFSEPGKKATFSPSVNDRGYIIWDCHNAGISQDLLPALCAK